jgi:nucleotide-binding universal stress UspA family protein
MGGARIVVPLDGSRAAEAILPYVWALLARLRADVVLVRAVDPPAAVMNGFHPILTASEDNVREYLIKQREPFLRAGIPVRIAVRWGGALPGILEEAGRPDVALVAMATHGRSGLPHLLLGGVCEGVLRETPVPVFALRPFRPAGFRRPGSGTESAFRNVLVPLDASGASLSILPAACAFAKRFDARLVFLHVLDPQKAALSLIGAPERGRSREEAPPLETAAQQCALEGVRSRIVVDSGRVSDRILACSRSEEIDLIAMTTHGRSTLSRFVFGSVSGDILGRSEVPLLLCRESPDRD